MFNLDQQAALGLTEQHLVEFNSRLVERHIVSDLSALIKAASKDNIILEIASSFRDAKRQTLIWNNKFSGKRPVFDIKNQVVSLDNLSEQEKCQRIMLFSAIPGASRHHFGTDLDVYDKSAVSSDYQLQ